MLLSSHNRPDGDFVVHSRLSETAKNKSEARFSIIELKLDKSQSDTHTPKEREERKKRRERKKEKERYKERKRERKRVRKGGKEN